MTRKGIALLCFVLFAGGLYAQGWSYGFRAGLSYSKLVADVEMDAEGNALETYKLTSGFHIGGSIDYGFTDLVGVRAEVLFSQRGTEYRYEGDSYYFLARNSENRRLIMGNRQVDLNVSTANIEIPLMAYYKLGPVEFSGGLSIGVLVAATGGGTLDFDGVSAQGNDIEPFRVTLTHNYNKDEAMGSGPYNMEVVVDGTTIFTPSRTGAYYNFDEKPVNWYSTFDIGLAGGISFFLNEGLYLGGRIVYGLTDADRNDYDISYKELNPDGSYIFRDRTNRNLTIQASLGFLF